MNRRPSTVCRTVQCASPTTTTATSSRFGMPATDPTANALSAGLAEAGKPLETCRTTPMRMELTASDATNAAMDSRTTAKPMTRPPSAPATSASPTAAQTGSPDPAGSLVASTAASAIPPGTDRSMPPWATTRVCPSAAIAITAANGSMDSTAEADRLPGEMSGLAAKSSSVISQMEVKRLAFRRRRSSSPPGPACSAGGKDVRRDIYEYLPGNLRGTAGRSDGGVAAVHGHVRAGDEAGGGAQQEGDHLGHLVGVRQAGDRVTGDEPLPGGLGVRLGPEVGGQLLGDDRSGADHVAPDPRGGVVDSDLAGQLQHRSLGGAVGGLAGQADPAGDRGEVDDRPRRPLGEHRAHHVLAQQEGPGRVDRHDPVPVVQGGVDQRFRHDRGGAVDQAVDAAPSVDGRLDGLGD